MYSMTIAAKKLYLSVPHHFDQLPSLTPVKKALRVDLCQHRQFKQIPYIVSISPHSQVAFNVCKDDGVAMLFQYFRNLIHIVFRPWSEWHFQQQAVRSFNFQRIKPLCPTDSTEKSHLGTQHNSGVIGAHPGLKGLPRLSAPVQECIHAITRGIKMRRRNHILHSLSSACLQHSKGGLYIPGTVVHTRQDVAVHIDNRHVGYLSYDRLSGTASTSSYPSHMIALFPWRLTVTSTVFFFLFTLVI